MELWAGFECTLNRVGDRFRDQLMPGERAIRTECLRMLPDLGVRAFRYRIAWDDIVTPPAETDADLALLAEGGIEPIIGLLHHGSGPRHTDLLSDSFAPGLAEHARLIVERYPDVTRWTPVNEPLTTARFAALYGHWYPHERSERALWQALLNQVDATRLAMREIRRVNPDAQLVQTEDLGRTFGTAALRGQVAYDNQRRWMTWDLLTGRVDADHPFHERLTKFGFGDRLRAIADDPCPPDVIGVDHYLTSDRFIDHRTARYPVRSHGGNAQRAYADVEAVRVLSMPRDSVATALREAWARYRIPVALTECHNGCTREEQMRWFREAWQAAEQLVIEGCDIRAVTSWALIGAHDWSTLATANGNDFECGAFDPRGGTARPTGLAHVLKAAATGAPMPLAARGDGWWRRPDRLHYRTAAASLPVPRRHRDGLVAPLVIAGASGTLGQALYRAARARGLPVVALNRDQLPLDDERLIAAIISRHGPWAVINATGWVRVDDAEADPDGCMRVNVDAALALARACDSLGIPHAHFSSDLVFDGQQDRAYLESDDAAPLGIYGRSKTVADARLLRIKTALVVRTAAFFSPFDPHNFAFAAVDSIRAGGNFAASAQHRVSPTYVPHLADFVLNLLIDGETGVWHASNGEELSWHDFAQRLADGCKLDPDMVEHAEPQDLGWIAPRPERAGLATEKGQMMPPLELAIAEFARAI